MAKISVIVPVYNVEKYLKRGLSSLISQTLEELEIIIINDGSTDASLDICRQFEEQDSRITVINKINEGVSIARNIGIEYATSEYIVFFDPDDEISENMYEQLYKDITSSGCDICLCNYLEIGTKKKEIKLPYSSGKYGQEIVQAIFFDMIAPKRIGDYSIIGSPWRGIYRKDIIDEYSITFPPNIRPMQDLIFNLKYLLQCKNIFINEKFLYKYYAEIGSGVRGYKENYYENGKRVFELIESFKLQKESSEVLEERLRIRWFIFILNNIEMIIYQDSKNTLPQKKRILERILYDDKTKYYLEKIDVKEYSMKIKYLYNCIKKCRIFLLIIYYKLAGMIRKI